MNEMLLKIKGVQKIQGEPDETVEFMTMGKVYSKGESVYIVYEETALSGMEGCTTTMKVTGDSAKMVRFAKDQVSNVKLEFEKGKAYRSMYMTPMGQLELAIKTNSVHNHLTEDCQGHIDIDYDIALMGVLEAKNILDIELIGGKRNESENC